MDKQVKVLISFALLATVYCLMGALLKIGINDRSYSIMFYLFPIVMVGFSLMCKLFLICDKNTTEDLEAADAAAIITQLPLSRFHKRINQLMNDDPPPYWEVVEKPPSYENLKRLSLPSWPISLEDQLHTTCAESLADFPIHLSRRSSASETDLGFTNPAYYYAVRSPKLQRSLSLSSLPPGLFNDLSPEFSGNPSSLTVR